MSVYATSDWHGYMGIYSEVKAFLEPDDVVYFLGDANDRGIDGYSLMKLIYDDPQFKYLKGNHEQMFIDVARSWKSSGLSDEQCYKFNTSSYRMIKNNQGVRTFDDWRKEGSPMQWPERLDLLPLYDVYTNKDGMRIFLSHAGCTLWQERGVEDGSITLFDDLLWSREHIYDEWDEQCPANFKIVHGHTPIPHLKEKLGDWSGPKIAPYWYADNHKCCLDQLTFSTGCTCLMDLDTFEYKIFRDPHIMEGFA